jgi:hypothetical protein
MILMPSLKPKPTCAARRRACLAGLEKHRGLTITTLIEEPDSERALWSGRAGLSKSSATSPAIRSFWRTIARAGERGHEHRFERSAGNTRYAIGQAIHWLSWVQGYLLMDQPGDRRPDDILAKNIECVGPQTV